MAPLSADYLFVWFDGLKRFYVSAERLELLNVLQLQPNVFDNFLKYTEVQASIQLSLALRNLAVDVRHERKFWRGAVTVGLATSRLTVATFMRHVIGRAMSRYDVHGIDAGPTAAAPPSKRTQWADDRRFSNLSGFVLLDEALGGSSVSAVASSRAQR